MKKLFTVLLMVLSVSVMADYAYKFNNGKVSKFKVIPASQKAEFEAKGFTVSTDKLATEKAVGPVVFARYDSISASERIQAETVFSKLEIRETFDSIIVQAKTDTLPQITLGDLLSQVLASNTKFATYWADADRGIDITYPTVVEALAQFPVTLDIPALKLAILQNRMKKAK